MDFLSVTREQASDRRKVNMGRASWSVERILLVLTFVCSVLAFMFGVGMNWSRLTAQESAITSLQQSTVPREVYQSDQRYLTESINRLTRAIENLEAAQRRVPARGQ